MDKEQEIEEMAETLYAPHLESQNDGYGELCRGCRKWYEDEPCKEQHKCNYYKRIAKHLQDSGYGDVRQAVNEFAEKLKKNCVIVAEVRMGVKSRTTRVIWQERIDELAKEICGDEVPKINVANIKPKVITLCGSTKFKTEFEAKNRELTLAGNIVISVACFGHSGDTFTDEQKVLLDEIHKRKIDLADAIYVINKDGYIGSSTRGEIEYAKALGKEIIYMETAYEENKN